MGFSGKLEVLSTLDLRYSIKHWPQQAIVINRSYYEEIPAGDVHGVQHWLILLFDMDEIKMFAIGYHNNNASSSHRTPSEYGPNSWPYIQYKRLFSIFNQKARSPVRGIQFERDCRFETIIIQK